jgi:hypothetical protein
MDGKIVFEPVLYRFAVMGLWDSAGSEWSLDRRFKSLKKARKYANREANRGDGYIYRVVDTEGEGS